MQTSHIVIIVLIIIIGIGLDYIVYQKDIANEQKIKIEQLSDMTTAIKNENEGLNNKLSSLNQRIGILDSKISQYLDLEGRKCMKDTITCLDELNANLEPSELRCDPISDGVCPPFCGLSLDYDCCIEKGYRWIQGQGCYS